MSKRVQFWGACVIFVALYGVIIYECIDGGGWWRWAGAAVLLVVMVGMMDAVHDLWFGGSEDTE